MGESFASGLNFYKQFWIFFIGCFFGVVIETVWCFIRFRKIESRKGLIYGPFNPVYGLGALVMTLSLYNTSGLRDLWIIIFGTVIGGIYEYICSVFQEKMLGSVSWDYKKFPLNIKGRVNLLYCVFWGILALLWVRDIYPKMSVFIERIPASYGAVLTWILFAFMVFDIIISSCAVYRMNERKNDIPSYDGFRRFLDRRYPDKMLEKIYPNMKFKAVCEQKDGLLI